MKLVFCWHMHQPWYKVEADGEYVLPWVYLHAMKDYSDMAAHLEHNPTMKAVVNFSPVLLLQIEDYIKRIGGYLHENLPIGDSLLDYLALSRKIPLDVVKRRELINACQRAHAPTMIRPYPIFNSLVSLGKKADDEQICYFNEQYFIDLLVWYHLAWVGHDDRSSPAIQELSHKGRDFNHDDLRKLMTFIYDTLAGLIGRYSALIKRGQVELSITPWGHPIAPLLKNFDNMRCSQPHDPLPASASYPGGLDSVRWHISEGLAVAKRMFGIKPKTAWMSEGAISADTLCLLGEAGFENTASGENVWRNSCQKSQCLAEDVHNKRALFRPYVHESSPLNIFFRDDGMSDLIGFEYSSWDAKKASQDFIKNLNNVHDFLGDEADDCVISIILDGENAWEYYEKNGWDFLEQLYQGLSASPKIQSATFSEVNNAPSCATLSTLCPGSWVYGTFSTWIGQEDKNCAWDLVVAAKKIYDDYIASHSLEKSKAERLREQMAICEGSDWFWWFGDYNPGESVMLFDKLFRAQLKHLYQLMGHDIPSILNIPISHGTMYQASNSGAMIRN